MRWPLGKLKKYSKNPILTPSKKNRFESAAVYNPTAVVKNNKVYLFYRAEQHYYSDYISKICLAVGDGEKFKRKGLVISPEKRYEKRGCEDPRICEIDGKYYLTYVAFSGKKTSIALAESSDLINWKKHGLIMRNTKSGCLLPRKIDGKYVLYFGDTNIYLAESKNLKEWKVYEEPVLTPRADNFDSRLVEAGCSLITKKGIFLIYNSSDGDEYKVGYAMFSKNNPSKLISRTNKPVLFPGGHWEKYGKVNYVVFASGLVEKNGCYYLYYGGADKSIGLAIGKKIY